MAENIEIDGDNILIPPKILDQIIENLRPELRAILYDLPTVNLRKKQIEIWLEAGAIKKNVQEGR